MDSENENIIVLNAKESKDLFKKMRAKGFIVDKGKCTGNIYTPDRKRCLYWMMEDMLGNWILEKLY